VHVSKFKDAEHLVRLAGSVRRWARRISAGASAHFVPKSFGEYGHYRGDALAELSHEADLSMPVTRPAKTAMPTCCK
jgi:hypothetical protein